jgi:hypothetical protein
MKCPDADAAVEKDGGIKKILASTCNFKEQTTILPFDAGNYLQSFEVLVLNTSRRPEERHK